MDKKRIEELFASDEFGLLDLPEKKRAVQKKKSLTVRKFDEIVEFYEQNGRLPEKDGGIIEKRLATRLAAMKRDTELCLSLQDYDVHGLLSKDTVEEAPATIESIMENDSLGLLDEEPEIRDIYTLRHVKPTDRIDPDYVARHKLCADFDQKYRAMFEEVIADLNNHRRELKEFSPDDLEAGGFYVLRGMVIYVENDESEMKEFGFSTGSKVRRDGRTRCIFANGTETPLLYRSLVKALQKDGLTITDIIQKDTGVSDTIDDDDSQNGFIYVLSSLSTNPKIQAMGNLYKIGFCSGDVSDRIKNASKEPTYLMADVRVVLTARCYNLNVRNLEGNIHKFFGKSNVDFTVKDGAGNDHHPKEWFVVPLDIIEKAIELVKEDRIQEYRYEPSMNSIIKVK